MPRTLDEIIAKLNEMTAPPAAIAATNQKTAAPTAAEIRQAQQYISGIRAAAEMAENKPLAQQMAQAAIAAAASHGIGGAAVGAYSLSQADRSAYLQGQLLIVQACGCDDAREEIRIKDNARSLGIR